MAKILIVEDDLRFALCIQHEVELLGHEVVGPVECADAAIIASAEHRPDLVLMDVNIDGSMDGIDTAHKLHADYQLPVIFLTSACDDLTISRAVQETPYGYLIKPFKRHDLKAAIQLALHNAGVNAAAECLAKR